MARESMMQRLRRKMFSEGGFTPEERARAEGEAEASVKEKLESYKQINFQEREEQERQDQAARDAAVEVAADVAVSLEDNPKYGAALRSVERVRTLVAEGGQDQAAIEKSYIHARGVFNELERLGLSSDEEVTLYGAMNDLDKALGQGSLRNAVMDKAA